MPKDPRKPSEKTEAADETIPAESGPFMITGIRIDPRREIEVTEMDRRIAEVLLDRDRTAGHSHGGLKGLLGLNEEQRIALLDLLRRLSDKR